MAYILTGRKSRLLGALPPTTFDWPDIPPPRPPGDLVIVEPPPPIEPPVVIEPPLIALERPIFPDLDLPNGRPPEPPVVVLPPPIEPPLIYHKPPVDVLPGQEVRPQGETGPTVETGSGIKWADIIEIKPIIIATPGEARPADVDVLKTAGLPGWLQIGLVGAALFMLIGKRPTLSRRRPRRRPRRRRR